MPSHPKSHRVPHLTIACALMALCHVPVHAATPQAQTTLGALQGETRDGVHQFLGIAYAAPPTGPLRWKAPQTAESWPGVRQATRTGPACPQLRGQYSGTAATATSEDCLTLNVYAPATPSSTPRPVLVWLHPGSLTMGAGSDYDGKALARQADAVVVTVNHRLGALGFLSTMELQQEAPASNYALQDQQQALRWVRDNIAAFGGDTRRVTLAGNSAGAASTCAHLVSPASAGLFQRAIMQSGPCIRLGSKTLEQARAEADRFASQVNCPSGAGQLACLRSRPADELIAAAGDGLDALQTANPWGPVIDGQIIPAKITSMIRDGAIHKVPILLGTTADEGRFFVAYSFHQQRGRAMTADDYTSAAAVMTGSAFAGSTSRSLYTAARYGSIDLAMSALMTDAGFACPMLTDASRLSRHVPVHVYEFTDTQAPAPADPHFVLGAYHTGELQYLFGAPVFATQLTSTPTPAQNAMAATIVQHWAAFMASGDPNHPLLPKWHRFNELTMPIMNLAPGQTGLQAWAAFGQKHRCLTWSLLLALSGQN